MEELEMEKIRRKEKIERTAEQSLENRMNKLKKLYSTPLKSGACDDLPIALNTPIVDAIRRGLKSKTTGVHVLAAPPGSGICSECLCYRVFSRPIITCQSNSRF